MKASSAADVNHIRVTTSGRDVLLLHPRRVLLQRRQAAEDRQRLAEYSARLFKLVPNKSGDKIIYDTVPLNGPVAPGDILAVRLTVTGSEWKYLLTEDPIPAGTEFIARDDNYEFKSRPPWWQYAFTRRELHDDRMAIFETFFPQGQQEYFYLLKVVNAGIFQMSPARVQPMYQPNFLSTTESRRLEVNDPHASQSRPPASAGQCCALVAGLRRLSMGESTMSRLVGSLAAAILILLLAGWLHGRHFRQLPSRRPARNRRFFSDGFQTSAARVGGDAGGHRDLRFSRLVVRL